MTFQILCLSGGGYRGLFTAEVLAQLETQAGRPIGECFDLIAGTSIGGIIALGLGLGHRASAIRDAFIKNGPAIFPPQRPPRRGILGKWDKYKAYSGGPRYQAAALRQTVKGIVGEETLLGTARTRILIPAVNMTEGRVQMFKTPHHPTLTMDQHRKVLEIAMATSAAPTFFPLAKVGKSLYADGGLAANSPDACAVHEAVHFAGQNRADIRVLSIGTTSSNFGLPQSLGASFGPADWITNERLVSTVFGVQQQLVDFMLKHDLKDRYYRIDTLTSAEHARDVGLDVATEHAQGTLIALAEGCYQRACTAPQVLEVLTHKPAKPNFVKN
jgi:hypothetical protein